MRSPLLPALATALLLGACGGDDGSLEIGIGGGQARLDLAITDAPVDRVSSVSVRITGVELQAAAGERIRFEFTVPQQIDLLDLRGGATRMLLSDEPVPSGRYQWLRLLVRSAPDSIDSFALTDTGQQLPLHVTGAGLTFDGDFNLSSTRRNELVVDVDLRRALTRAASGDHFVLRPVLRLIDTRDAGSLAGTVDSVLVDDVRCGAPGGNAVYVYSGFGIVPGELGGADAEPLTTAEARFVLAANAWRYLVPFLPAGAYTVAFTCEAELDEPDTDDGIRFGAAAEATVTAGFRRELDL